MAISIAAVPVNDSPRVDDFSEGAAFVDGDYVPIGEAKMSILDLGFTRSDVTYDVIHVWKGSFFRLEDHLERFQRSCSKLRLDTGHDRDAMRDILMQCVRRSGLRDAYVDIICTRGRPGPGNRDLRTCENNFMAYAVPFIWVLSPEIQQRGGHLHISNVPRIPASSVDPTVKNFHWGDLTQGLFQALDRGADTAVLVDPDGFVSEGPGFNVFCVFDGNILSPGDTVLEGVTRASVRELAEELGYTFSLARVTPETFRDADEVFLSSTAGGIMPISRVDDRILCNDSPGPITTKLRDRYWAKHEEGWHATPVDYS